MKAPIEPELMSEPGLKEVWNVDLPWSNGCMSARMWQKDKRTVVSVPELDICCYGKSQSEAVLRLFTNLLKYYNELSRTRTPLTERQQAHFELLKKWMRSVEDRMTVRESAETGSRRVSVLHR